MGKYTKAIKVNWFTSLMGTFLFLGALSKFGLALMDTDPETVADLHELINAWNSLAGGAGLIAARNAWTSSRESGLH